uniref:Uncharacterized protein n=1 Tax=Pipistrellus kuhlii TaxID=59472 RepID=A0A7J7TKM2_PIPKU|nr:hypothetical protein mPipKuh1_009341 [Pipistrellus kuhlii]
MFSFVLSYRAPDVPSVLLSGGRRSDERGGPARGCSPGPGHRLHSLSQGGPSPPPHAQESQRAPAVQPVAKLAWWQKGGRGFCQGLLLWFLPSLPVPALLSEERARVVQWPRRSSGFEPWPRPCHHSPFHL